MTLIFIVLIVLAVILLLLALPLEIEVFALVHGCTDLTVRLKLIYGLISWELGRGDNTKPESKNRIQDEGDFSVFSNVYEAVQTRDIWEQVRLLLKGLSGHIKIRHFDSDFKVSLGDDYYTGMLAGLALPLALLVNQRFGTDIRIVPAFEEDLIMEGYLKSTIDIRPVEVIIPCLAFVCSPSVRQVRKILF
ncbi:MAG: hypothetical protein ACYDHZ_09700 [Dehalococcoidia bacterium]